MRALSSLALIACSGCASRTWATDPANLPPAPCAVTHEGAPRLIVRRAYRADRHAHATMSFVVVDGATVFQSSERIKIEQRLATLYDHEVAAGLHQIRVVERVEGTFRYFPGEVEFPVTFHANVPAQGSACLTYTVYAGGDPASKHPSLPSIRREHAP